MTILKNDYIDFWAYIGENWYLEDSTFADGPDDNLPEVLEGDGALCYQGENFDDDKKGLFKDGENRGVAFSTVFKRWKKLSSVTKIIVTCPNNKADEIKKAIKEIGGICKCV